MVGASFSSNDSSQVTWVRKLESMHLNKSNSSHFPEKKDSSRAEKENKDSSRVT